MKEQQKHRGPLTNSTITIFGMLPQIDHNPTVFPGSRTGRPLSNMALLQVLRGIRFGVTGLRDPFVPHGFRSSFCDSLWEVSGFREKLLKWLWSTPQGTRSKPHIVGVTSSRNKPG